MKAPVKIILILLMLLPVGSVVLSQSIPGIQDTAAIRQQRTEAKAKVEAQAENKAEVEAQNKTKAENKVEVKDQNRAKEMTKNQTQAHASENGQVKKVTSARPDMSKAKGARPGSIVRPAGSRLPKGVGRPGGASGRGRR